MKTCETPIVGDRLAEVVAEMKIPDNYQSALIAICTRADNSGQTESSATETREGGNITAAIRAFGREIKELEATLSRSIFFKGGEIHFSPYIPNVAEAA